MPAARSILSLRRASIDAMRAIRLASDAYSGPLGVRCRAHSNQSAKLRTARYMRQVAPLKCFRVNFFPGGSVVQSGAQPPRTRRNSGQRIQERTSFG